VHKPIIIRARHIGQEKGNKKINQYLHEQPQCPELKRPKYERRRRYRSNSTRYVRTQIKTSRIKDNNSKRKKNKTRIKPTCLPLREDFSHSPPPFLSYCRGNPRRRWLALSESCSLSMQHAVQRHPHCSSNADCPSPCISLCLRPRKWGSYWLNGSTDFFHIGGGRGNCTLPLHMQAVESRC